MTLLHPAPLPQAPLHTAGPVSEDFLGGKTKIPIPVLQLYPIPEYSYSDSAGQTSNGFSAVIIAPTFMHISAPTHSAFLSMTLDYLSYVLIRAYTPLNTKWHLLCKPKNIILEIFLLHYYFPFSVGSLTLT